MSAEQGTEAPVANVASRVEAGATWLLVVLVLVLPTIVGRPAPYFILAIGVMAWVAFLAQGRLLEMYRPFAARTWLIAFLLLAALFALTMQVPADVLRVFNFVMLPVGGAVLFLFTRAAGRIAPAAVTLMAAAGVALTLLMVGIDALLGSPRPQGFNLGQIVLSNAAMALSVIAATGAIALRSRWSLWLPVAIAVAAGVTLLTQSRGPLLGVGPLALLTLVALWRVRLRGRGLWIALVTLILLACIALAALVSGRVAALPHIVTGVFQGGGTGDPSVEIRLNLYRAGWRAFSDAPWLGHGWARLMSAPMAYIPPDFVQLVKPLHHLHNDVLDFAVSGGVAGVAIYLTILFAPLVAAWRSPRDSLRPARLYGTAGLTIVYALGGLTDLTFGQEYHTALFVTLNALVLGLFRAAAPRAPAA